MKLEKSIKKTERLVINKDGKSIGRKVILITRDFMCFINELGNDEIEICLVKPTTREGTKE